MGLLLLGQLFMRMINKMGRIVRIPNSIWLKMSKEEKERYYAQEKKNNVIIGIIVGITFILALTVPFIFII